MKMGLASAISRPEFLVQGEVDGSPRWLATKGPGKTNHLTKLKDEAFVFEERAVAELYAKIWAEAASNVRVVETSASQ